MGNKKANYKQFSKPFWRMLSISVLSTFLVYGGIVWAVAGNPCRLYSNGSTTQVGGLIDDIAGWTVVRRICQRVDPHEEGEFDIVNIEDEANQPIGQLRITNSTTDKDYFVPFKYDRERIAFIKNKPTGIEICEEGIPSTQESVFNESDFTAAQKVYGCGDETSCPAPTLNELIAPNQISFDLNGVTAPTTFVYTSTDGINWSSSAGSPTSPRTIGNLVSGNYYKMTTYCNGSQSDDSNVLQYTAGGGACEGTYTTAGTSTKVDWNGDPLNWQVGTLYNDAGEAIYDCGSSNIPHNVDIWHTTNAPSTSDDNGTWGDANGTDNYYCEYIGGPNQLSNNGSYTCTQDGSGNWMVSGGGPNNNGLNSQSQSIKTQLCSYNYTTALRFWAPADSGNWARYITAAGTGFAPGYIVTKNGYQGVLTANVGGGTTMQCSNLTSYGQSYCETNPANAGCVWNPNG